MVITSIQNPRIKILKALKTKKGRQKYSHFIIEGANILKDLPPHIDVVELYIKESSYSKLSFLEERLGLKAVILEDYIFDSVSDTKTPIGALAVSPILESREASGDTIVLLDNISDAGNLGTIIRTAAARGIDTILLYGNCANIHNPKTVRASMGGMFYVNLKKADDKDIDKLIDKGYTLIGLDMNGKSVYDYKRQDKIILIVGSEAHGLSQSLKEKCAKTLSIPIKNVESLNAAISLSIALYLI
ncbi:MAG: RNA methyltransferase [Bacillota bacterium]|jgi:TrmH family RNA methyltransferase|nr:RNA methyltransferase [Bacillota bacterium]HHU42715.1 RNA methyltransferase [Clostridiales bacterium]